MKQLDLKRQLKHLYGPSIRSVVEVDVPPMNFLMVDGAGDPNTSPEYGDAVEALFAASYATKFAVKKGPLAIDYGVMPLEGLWWSEEMADFTAGNRENWQWTMMIMQPDFVSAEFMEQVVAEVSKKKTLPALPLVRFERYSEGLAAQVMHVGPFADEAPTIERVHGYIEGSGCVRLGKHHEIYLSDIRKADPAKWNTVIRQPMRSSAPQPEEGQ